MNGGVDRVYQWRYDPEFGVVLGTGEYEGSLYAPGLNDFRTKFRIGNGRLYNRSGNTYVTSLPSTREVLFRATVDENGNINRLAVQKEIPTSQINNMQYQRSGYAAAMDFDILTPGGVTEHFQGEFARVSPPGYLLLYNDTGDWRTSYKYIKWYPEIRQVDIENFFPGFRPATAEESMEYYVRGMLFARYQDRLRELWQSGQLEAEVGSQDTFSDAVQALARKYAQTGSAALFLDIYKG